MPTPTLKVTWYGLSVLDQEWTKTLKTTVEVMAVAKVKNAAS
jgi:hypothetical protein